MKKLLLFIAAIFVSSIVFSQTYSFVGLTTDDFTNLLNGTIVPTAGTAAPFTVNYTSPDFMTLTVKGVNLRYKNSANKTSIIKVDPAYMQFDGKNFEILLSGLTVGQEIIVNVSAKSTTNTIFSVTGATVDSPTEATTTGITNATYVDVTMTATAADVIIKEINNGGRFKSIEIRNTSTSVKTPLADNGIRFNGISITNDQNLNLKVFNSIGKEILTSNSTISMASYPKGIYIVKAEGINDVLKFIK